MQSWTNVGRGSVMALAMTLLASNLAQAQTTLRYQFKAGEKFAYALDQDMKMAMNIGGKDIDIHITQQMDMLWDVQAVDDQGNAQVQLKMGRVKMAMKNPMGAVEVDSSNPKELDDPVGKVFGQVVQTLADMQLTFAISGTGTLKDVKMSEKTLKDLKNLPGVDKLGGDMFSPEGMKRMVQGGLTLPQEAVKKGDDWSQKTDLKLPFGKTTGDIKYVYEGPTTKEGRALEKIAFTPDVKIVTDPKNPFQIKVKEQEGKGVVYFDNRAGRLESLSSETIMTMVVEAQNMTINQRVVQVTSIRLKGPDAKRAPTPPTQTD